MSTPLFLANKYALLRRLGQGGMAEVFLAKQVGLAGFEKLVVVKRTLRELADDDVFKQMFLDEARTAADLRHPNIVDIYEIGEDRGRLFLTMEFLHGRDLGAVLRRCVRRQEPPPLAVTLHIVEGVAAGLDYAHTKTGFDGSPQNIVHRDISPQNIVVTYAGEPKIVDFGIARAASRDQHTQEGQIRGKVAYISPEQIEGGPVDGRADMFALGIVLYELTTLRPLFHRKRALESISAILQGDIPLPSKVYSGYPSDLEAIVVRTLAQHPSDRFTHLGELVEAIDDFAERHRLRLTSRHTGRWLRRLFADEIEDDRSLAHMPTLDTTGEMVANDGHDEDAAFSDAWRAARIGTREIQEETAIAAAGDFGAESQLSTTLLPHASSPGLLILPDYDTAFVGRQQLMRKVRDTYTDGAGLITLVGGIGVGKTRLALEFARRLHEDGLALVRHIELSEARTVEEIISATAHALDISLLSGASVARRKAQVSRALEALSEPNHRTLLLFDHMPLLKPDEIQALLQTWLHATQGLSMMVTSRRPLAVDGEAVIKVGGLSVPCHPDDARAVLASEAGQLFVTSIKDERPSFVVTDALAPRIARALRKVDGRPLAVELAAARLMQLDDAQSYENEPSLQSHANEELTEPLEHAIDQAVQWAVASLPADARYLVAQAAVFAGGFSLSIAEHVFLDQEGRPLNNLQARLDLLRARALCRAWEPAGLAGDLRFGVVGSLRSRLSALLSEADREALDKRIASALIDEALDHARWVDGPGGPRMFARLAAETENLVEILATSLRTTPQNPGRVSDALRASLALDPVLSARGYTDRQLRLMDSAIEAGRQEESIEPKLLAMALEARADAYKSRGMYAKARADYLEGLSKAKEASDRWFVGLVHRNLADVELLLENSDAALAHCQQAHTLMAAAGDRHFEGRALLSWGQVHLARREHSAAADCFTKALDVFRHVGDRRFEGRALSLIAELRHEDGKPEQAIELYAAAISVHREVDDGRQLTKTLIAQSRLLRSLGHHEEAEKQLRTARKLSRAMGNRTAEGYASHELALVAQMTGDKPLARKWLERARDVLTDAGNTTLLPRIVQALEGLGSPQAD